MRAWLIERWRLESAMVAFKHRLLAELSERPTLETLERVRGVEGNALTLTPSRTVAVDDIARAAAKLLDELVRIPDHRRQGSEE